MNLLENKSRIYYYDMLRAFAIFCVISCHVFAPLVIDTRIFNTNLWYYSMIMNSLRDIGVPLFVMISGALLITKKESALTFIKKRINKVIIPYLFWVFAFIMLGHYFLGLGKLHKLIIKTLSLNPDGAGVFFWFVPMILTVYLIILIINKIHEKNEKILPITLILSLIIIIPLNCGLSITKPLQYILYIIYAILGYYLSKIDLNTKSKILPVIFIIISIGLFLLEIYINSTTSISLNKQFSISQFSIINICCVTSVFLSFKTYSNITNDFNKIKKHLTGKIIYSISICSYGIYLSHVIIMRSLVKISNTYKNDMNMGLYITIILILTTIISWLLILGLSKIPVLKKISGV